MCSPRCSSLEGNALGRRPPRLGSARRDRSAPGPVTNARAQRARSSPAHVFAAAVRAARTQRRSARGRARTGAGRPSRGGRRRREVSWIRLLDRSGGRCVSRNVSTVATAEAEYRLPTAERRLPPAACRLPSAARRLPPAACRLPSAARRLPPAACRLPPAACRSPLAARRPAGSDARRPGVAPTTVAGRALLAGAVHADAGGQRHPRRARPHRLSRGPARSSVGGLAGELLRAAREVLRVAPGAGPVLRDRAGLRQRSQRAGRSRRRSQLRCRVSLRWPAA
jgi:hypothetical protein